MLLTVTCLAVFLCISVAEPTSLSQVYKYPEDEIYSDYREPGDTKLVYARCNSSLPESAKKCIVTMKLDAFESHQGETKDCPVELKPELPSGVIYSFVWVHAFGDDKVLLVWRETQNATEERIERAIVKTTVLHMFDNCRTYETKVHTYVETSDMYLDRHITYHIIFEDSYEIKVGGIMDNCTEPPPKCEFYHLLYKFDDQGRRIGEVEDWSKSTFNVTRDPSFTESVKLRQAEKIYFLTTRYGKSWLLELMRKISDGYQKLQLRNNSCDNSSRMMFSRSLVKEAIGFCYLCPNSSLGCWRSDQKGRINMETQFTLSQPYATDIHGVSNLQNGGLLLAALKDRIPDFNYSGVRSTYYDNYYFMEVDAKGNVKAIEVLFETKCYYKDNYASVRLFKNKQRQYCIARLCESKYDEPNLLAESRIETLVRCYSSNELSKCNNSKCL